MMLFLYRNIAAPTARVQNIVSCGCFFMLSAYFSNGHFIVFPIVLKTPALAGLVSCVRRSVYISGFLIFSFSVC